MRPIGCRRRNLGDYWGAWPIFQNRLSIGAGEGNRTLVISLEGCCSTIELHPRTRSTLRPPSPCGLRRGSLRARRLACRAEAPVRARRLVGEVGLEPTKA